MAQRWRRGPGTDPQALGCHNINVVTPSHVVAQILCAVNIAAEQGLRVDDVYDVVGFRALLASDRECYDALGVMHMYWRPVPGRFRDYIALPKANGYLKDIANTLDDAKQDQLWRQVGEQYFTQHKEIPLFWLPVVAVADPKVVGDWMFPGSLTGSFSHVENIKPAG